MTKRPSDLPCGTWTQARLCVGAAPNVAAAADSPRQPLIVLVETWARQRDHLAMTEVQVLAKYVRRARLQDLSDKALEQLKIRVLDTIGVAIGALAATP
jgi:hypothetical protein